MVIHRGDIWWGDLPQPVGSGPGFRRPVLVVQSDRFNSSAINTVVIAIISKNTNLANSEGNVLLASQQSGLPKDSVVNVSQLFTVDESILIDYVSSVSEKKMSQIDIGLRKVLAL
jgi:mRNA interferase MazF